MESEGFTEDEQRLVENLRAKYSSRVDVTKQADQDGGAAQQLQHQAQHQDAPPLGEIAAQQAAAEAGAVASVRLCSLCNGSGRVPETYNHRVLEVCAWVDAHATRVPACGGRPLPLPWVRVDGRVQMPLH
jgi:hypothetical protein